MSSILITQCLQNDFTKLIDKYDPIPNLLHIGYDEARRLLSEKVENGPVHTVIDWAYNTNQDELKIIHIRDWHDSNDEKQKDHLNQFGKHCIKNTEGADFVFAKNIKSDREHSIINASGLNDFIDTNLEEVLKEFENIEVRVGLIGVWTEAKITFLAYELRTRYPKMDISICSALCASSSRTTHFIALDQLKSILGIRIFSSISDFTNYLAGSTPKLSIKMQDKKAIDIKFINPAYRVTDIDFQLLLYLYRESKEVEFECLDGGFSGNVVLKAKAKDKLGHYQVPTVVKIGKREPIAKERMSFEKIQEVLGNNAPNIVEFAELESRGAIKYRYAAMLDNGVNTFQKYYSLTDDLSKIFKKLDIVFDKQLGRLYEASNYEKIDLLKYYEFSNKYASSVREKVESLIQDKAEGDYIKLEGLLIPNVCNFYEKEIKNLKEENSPYHYLSYLHGDLNGANIIIDAQENVWLIDFFHTHKGHILKDLVKLENDILFIFMNIQSQYEFFEAKELIDALVDVVDLGEPLNPKLEFQFNHIKKAYLIIQKLRSFYPKLVQLDRDPFQLNVAQMRYAMHTLSFDESSIWQKKLALYAGCKCSIKILHSIKTKSKLRLDFIDYPDNNSFGKIALTILPGRKDRNRNSNDDIKTIINKNIKYVLCLITEVEFEQYGTQALKKLYKDNGINPYYYPILDQHAPDKKSIHLVLDWMHSLLINKNDIVIHCVGGLGRSGTIAACYFIKYYNLSPEQSIELVRRFRSERAIETKEQEEFIYSFAKGE